MIVPDAGKLKGTVVRLPGWKGCSILDKELQQEEWKFGTSQRLGGTRVVLSRKTD